MVLFRVPGFSGNLKLIPTAHRNWPVLVAGHARPTRLLPEAQECQLIACNPGLGKLRPAPVGVPSGTGPGSESYLVFPDCLVSGAEAVTPVAQAQTADEAEKLPVILTEQQLGLSWVALTLWQHLGAQAGHRRTLLQLPALLPLSWE